MPLRCVLVTCPGARVGLCPGQGFPIMATIDNDILCMAHWGNHVTAAMGDQSSRAKLPVPAIMEETCVRVFVTRSWSMGEKAEVADPRGVRTVNSATLFQTADQSVLQSSALYHPWSSLRRCTNSYTLDCFPTITFWLQPTAPPFQGTFIQSYVSTSHGP